MTTNARKSRHKALLKEVAALIGQPADSLAVELVALAKLKLEGVKLQLLRGDPSVTVADITALQEVFEKYVPKPKMEIRVSYANCTDEAPADSAAVSGLVACRRCDWRPFAKDRVERCYRCGWQHGDDVFAPWTPLIAERVKPPDSGNNTPAPSPINVVPLDKEERAAQLRAAARISNGVDPGPPRLHTPNIGSPISAGDNRSISQFQRDCDSAYRI